MNCTSATDSDNIVDLERKYLAEQPLAFETNSNDDNPPSSSWVAATSRLGVPVEHQGQCVWVNVEIFEQNTSSSTAPLVIYLPGICESAETKTVQNLAQWAKSIGIRLAVVELPGHGLSSGTLAETMPTDIHVLAKYLIQAIQRITAKLFQERKEIHYSLCGSSFGGTLALYVAEYISRRKGGPPVAETTTTFDPTIIDDEELWKRFFDYGVLNAVVSISPAVGVDPQVLPPGWLVSTLSVASHLFPSAQLPFTPYEDATQYNCPPTTKRNFQGRWPLKISKFLLDVTSKIVPNDIQQGALALKQIPRVILLTGAQDPMIPMDSVQNLEEQIESKSKELIVLPKVGHDVLTNSKSKSRALEVVFGSVL